MSEPYTPTTQGVLDTYIWCGMGSTSDEWDADRTAEFDRWLNEVKAQAWDRGHGAPCDEWWDSDMCREYHPNPYRKEN